MEHPIEQSAQQQLISVNNQIAALEKDWDKYDDDNRFIEKHQVELELKKLYEQQIELNNFLSK